MREEFLQDRVLMIRDEILSPRIIQDLEKYPIEVDKKHVASVIENGVGVFLCGETGTGKTLYACALLLEAVKFWVRKKEGPRTFKFITVADMLMDIRGAISATGSQDVVRIRYFSEVGLLVLDDLGAEKSSEWAVQIITQVVNTRYEYLRPTIITSNFGLQHLSEIDSRLPSRICGMCLIREFKGVDFRVENLRRATMKPTMRRTNA